MKTGKKNALITGSTGLIGTRFIELLFPEYNFTKIGRKEGVNIVNPQDFEKIIIQDCEFLFHFAAKTDVDGAEKERDLGNKSEAWKVNVEGTKNVADFCKRNSIKMIYLSTDFVFDGEKKEGEGYYEDDYTNPLNFYGKTKLEGEKMVHDSGTEYLIVRIAYPYRKEFSEKKDFVRSVISKLKNGLEVRGVTNQIICPTFIDDIVFCLKLLIEKNEKGIFHCVGDTAITPFEAIKKIADIFNLNSALIHPVTREEFYKDKANRPFNLYLKNDKIQKLGFTPKTFEEGLLSIK